MNNIIHGAYHSDFGKEIERLKVALEKAGINNPSKIEITALIAYKNRKAKMDRGEVIGFFKMIRGIK